MDLQAMDRCHRIGQSRPVLVLRMATSHSVEGRMLRRAAGKMALERLVIKKGVFKEVLEEVRAAARFYACVCSYVHTWARVCMCLRWRMCLYV